MKKKRRGIFWRVDKTPGELWYLMKKYDHINTAYYAALDGSDGIFARPRGGKWEYFICRDRASNITKSVSARHLTASKRVKNVRIVSEKTFNNFAAKHMGELL